MMISLFAHVFLTNWELEKSWKKVSGTLFLTGVRLVDSNNAMGRSQRAADGGMVYHVLNRGNARMPIFESDADYEALERVLEQAVERYGTDLLA
jgi:hypothetical protein